MGHITCVRGAGSPVGYIMCDSVEKCKGLKTQSLLIGFRHFKSCFHTKPFDF